MKKLILVLALNIISIAAFAGANRVYVLDGFFVHIVGTTMDTDTETLRKYVAANHPGTVFTAIHNSMWQSVCDEIKAEKPDHVVIVGHSYGGNAAVDIARCLKDQTVNMIVTFDAFQKFFAGPVDEVSNNVVSCHNFYEIVDPLQGVRNMHRPDGTQGGITNTEVTVTLPGSAHYGVVSEIVNQGIAQQLISQGLK